MNNAEEVYPLDDLTILAIQELRMQQHNIQMTINGVLMLYAKQHNLNGHFRLAANDRELILQSAPVPQ